MLVLKIHVCYEKHSDQYLVEEKNKDKKAASRQVNTQIRIKGVIRMYINKLKIKLSIKEKFRIINREENDDNIELN